MIIDKVKAYYTEEEKQRIKELESLQRGLAEDMDPVLRNNKYSQLEAEIFNIQIDVIKRYQEERQPLGLTEDAFEIIDAIEQEDYLNYVKSMKKLSETIEGRTKEENDKIFEVFFNNTYEAFYDCYEMIFFSIPAQLQGLDGATEDDLAIDIIKDHIYEKVSTWYDPPEIDNPPELPDINLHIHGEAPALQYSRPEKYLMDLTKVNKEIFSNGHKLADLADVAIDITPNTLKKKNKNASYLVPIGVKTNIEGLEKVTPFDMGVHNAIISIARENPHGFFTAKQVASFLYYGNNPSNSNPSEKSIEEIEESIEKLRHIDLAINYTQHMKLNKMLHEKSKDEYSVVSYMVPAKEGKATIGGHKLTGYQLIDRPPLETYSQDVNQLDNCDPDMLAVGSNLNSQKIAIRSVLIDEVTHMRNNDSWNRTITIDRLIRAGGENPDEIDRRKRSDILSFIKKALDTWKERKHIKGYTINKQGKANKSITIEP